MIKQAYCFIVTILLCMFCLSACGSGTDEAAKQGAELYAQSVIGNVAGCSGCHSLDTGVVIIGPSLAGIGSSAATRVSGFTAEDYLHEAIIAPDAFLVEGYPPGVMPVVYREVLNEQQINDLVSYLLTLK